MMLRARMWGVCLGDFELEHANMLENPRMNEPMARADLVLVNNKVFGKKREFPPPFRLSIASRY